MGVVKSLMDHFVVATPRQKHTACDSLIRYAERLSFGDIHIKIDKATGLKAIIAVHNLKRGPAIGGCRIVNYQTTDKAIEDAIRLAQMMSFKAAINLLPHGGAKAVLIKPKIIRNYEAYFQKFGDFVHELGGRYLTAVDSGTSPAEMDIIATRTPYVTCTSNSGADSDPSSLTAVGVLRGIQAAVKFKMGRDDLAGLHVVIQGAGHVGFCLGKMLKEQGAKLTIADINLEAIQHCLNHFEAEVCAPENVYDVKADIFAPCALGAILNLKTINRLQVSIVAGSANNQLAHQHHAMVLHERGILYAPDFLINAGGLIHVAVMYGKGTHELSQQKINGIYEQALLIFAQAAHENDSPNHVAIKIAQQRLG